MGTTHPEVVDELVVCQALFFPGSRPAESDSLQRFGPHLRETDIPALALIRALRKRIAPVRKAIQNGCGLPAAMITEAGTVSPGKTGGRITQQPEPRHGIRAH